MDGGKGCCKIWKEITCYRLSFNHCKGPGSNIWVLYAVKIWVLVSVRAKWCRLHQLFCIVLTCCVPWFVCKIRGNAFIACFVMGVEAHRWDTTSQCSCRWWKVSPKNLWKGMCWSLGDLRYSALLLLLLFSRLIWNIVFLKSSLPFCVGTGHHYVFPKKWARWFVRCLVLGRWRTFPKWTPCRGASRPCWMKRTSEQPCLAPGIFTRRTLPDGCHQLKLNVTWAKLSLFMRSQYVYGVTGVARLVSPLVLSHRSCNMLWCFIKSYLCIRYMIDQANIMLHGWFIM